VAAIEPATKFWQDRLGFNIGHEDDGYAVLIRDGIEIHLWAARDETWRDRPDRPLVTGAESFLAGTASARVLVREIDALFEEMRAAGVLHPNGPLGNKPYGLREFAILDLDGNLLTFFEPLRAEENDG
jgi:catechol 2,3-dioxygenase-like lactoylglutathione lyase family enzyme